MYLQPHCKCMRLTDLAKLWEGSTSYLRCLIREMVCSVVHYFPEPAVEGVVYWGPFIAMTSEFFMKATDELLSDPEYSALGNRCRSSASMARPFCNLLPYEFSFSPFTTYTIISFKWRLCSSIFCFDGFNYVSKTFYGKLRQPWSRDGLIIIRYHR